MSVTNGLTKPWQVVSVSKKGACGTYKYTKFLSEKVSTFWHIDAFRTLTCDWVLYSSNKHAMNLAFSSSNCQSFLWVLANCCNGRSAKCNGSGAFLLKSSNWVDANSDGDANVYYINCKQGPHSSFSCQVVCYHLTSSLYLTFCSQLLWCLIDSWLSLI